MAKSEQVLVLDPPGELHFKGPFDEVRTSYLKLSNPTDREIGFKVKTTAPKVYCVRPNGGSILPKGAITVAVMLQPFDRETGDRSKDKFMVQSVYVPEGETYADNLWHSVAPEGLMNSKLKCTFDFPAAEKETTEIIADVVDQPKPKTKVVHVQEVKATDIEAENKKLYEDFKKLKSELNDLRVENFALKEEGLRSRMAYDTRTRGTSAKPESESHQSLAKKQQPLPSSNYPILIAFCVFLLGVCIGKFFF